MSANVVIKLIREQLKENHDVFIPSNLDDWKAIGENLRERGLVERGNQFESLYHYCRALECALGMVCD